MANEGISSGSLEEHEPWALPADLGRLSQEQERIVQGMLKVESGAFARDDGDSGCARDLELEINVVDDKPVQREYNSIPKLLYGEAKERLQELINGGWINKSKSKYSLPVVCVRKKEAA